MKFGNKTVPMKKRRLRKEKYKKEEKEEEEEEEEEEKEEEEEEEEEAAKRRDRQKSLARSIRSCYHINIYRVFFAPLPGFPAYHLLYRPSLGFYWVFTGFFSLVWLGFSGFPCLILLEFCYRSSQSFGRFNAIKLWRYLH